MKNLITQNLDKIKDIFNNKNGNEARKALKEIFGKCSITLAKDVYGVTVITFENGDRVFIDSSMVEYKTPELTGFSIIY